MNIGKENEKNNICITFSLVHARHFHRSISSQAANACPNKVGPRIVNPRQAVGHGNCNCVAASDGDGCARQNLNDLRPARPARVPEVERVAVAIGALVAEHGDDLVAVEALAHGDGGAVTVDDPVLVGQVVGVVGDGLGADLVDGCDELVQLGVSVVAREPGGLAVVRVLGAGVVLLLPGVDDGDAVGEDVEREHVLRLREVGRDGREACDVVVLGEGAEQGGVLAA